MPGSSGGGASWRRRRPVGGRRPSSLVRSRRRATSSKIGTADPAGCQLLASTALRGQQLRRNAQARTRSLRPAKIAMPRRHCRPEAQGSGIIADRPGGEDGWRATMMTHSTTLPVAGEEFKGDERGGLGPWVLMVDPIQARTLPAAITRTTTFTSLPRRIRGRSGLESRARAGTASSELICRRCLHHLY